MDLPNVKFRRGELVGRGYVDLSNDAIVTDMREHNGLRNETEEEARSITPDDDVYTIDEAIDAIGFGQFQIKLSLFTGLLWMADAMEMMILSILGPSLKCEWGLSSMQQASLTMIVFAGMMVSSSIWGKISDLYGRKTELIMCSMVTLFYGLLSCLAPSFLWVIILRGFVGFGIGGAPQSVTLYAEFLPSSSRARCLVFIEFFWAIGACLVVIIAIVVMPTMGWRYLLFFSSLPLVVFLVACLWLPESIRFDMARGHYQNAMVTLKRIADDNGKPLPLGHLIMSGSSLKRTHPTEGKKVEKRGQLKELFSPELKRTTILLWFIWLANALSYYGIVLMTTELFSSQNICNDSEGMTRDSCPKTCTTLGRGDYMDLLYTTISEFPGLVVTFFIIDWLGRKWTIAVEFIIYGVFVLLLNTCGSRFVMASFIFVARAFISGAFQAVYVYTPEVYPTTSRALGLGSCSGMARVGAIITPFIAQVMLKRSIHVAICIYGFVALLGAIAALLLPIETKGRVLSETTVQCSHISSPRPSVRIRDR